MMPQVFTVTEDEVTQVKHYAEVAFNRVIAERLGEEHQEKGVYFRAALFIPTTQGLVLRQFAETWVGGEKNRGDQRSYRANSAEKILRLYNNQTNGHVSAYQSWLEGLNYPGAICVPVAIPRFGDIDGLMLALGASGLPYEADEAGCALTAGLIDSQVSWAISHKRLLYVLKISRNSLYHKVPEMA